MGIRIAKFRFRNSVQNYWQEQGLPLNVRRWTMLWLSGLRPHLTHITSEFGGTSSGTLARIVHIAICRALETPSHFMPIVAPCTWCLWPEDFTKTKNEKPATAHVPLKRHRPHSGNVELMDGRGILSPTVPIARQTEQGNTYQVEHRLTLWSTVMITSTSALALKRTLLFGRTLLDQK
jgi:hypothetical protein